MTVSGRTPVLRHARTERSAVVGAEPPAVVGRDSIAMVAASPEGGWCEEVLAARILLVGRRCDELYQIFLCAVGLVACGNDSDAVKRDLDGRLQAASMIFHVGCARLNPCGQSGRACSVTALRDEVVAHRPLVVEHESSMSEAGVFLSYYFVQGDGSGTKFYERKTDVADSDCGGYCGWHSESFSAIPVAVVDGTVSLEGVVPSDPSAPACTQ